MGAQEHEIQRKNVSAFASGVRLGFLSGDGSVGGIVTPYVLPAQS